MFRLVLILSIAPILAALAARWWFGLRVLATEGQEICRINPAKWPEIPGHVLPEKATAEVLGKLLHDQALAGWRTEYPAAAASRENSLRFGMAVPPFAAIIAIFTVLIGKTKPIAAIGIFIGSIAVSTLIGLLSLPAELSAITRTAARLRTLGALTPSCEADAVVRCALATAWLRSLPRVLAFLQR
ncbi:MAG: hypothetical protein V4733_05025 [Verrucomicrobiota bacterium]